MIFPIDFSPPVSYEEALQRGEDNLVAGLRIRDSSAFIPITTCTDRDDYNAAFNERSYCWV